MHLLHFYINKKPSTLSVDVICGRPSSVTSIDRELGHYTSRGYTR